MAELVLVLGSVPLQGLQPHVLAAAVAEPLTVAMLVSGRCACWETASCPWQQRW